MTSRRILWTVLRVLVCVGALFWVMHNVRYHDYVLLRTGANLRLLDDPVPATGPIRALDDAGQTMTLDREHMVADESGVIRVEYGLKSTIRSANVKWVFLAIVVFFPVTLFQSLRFLILLRAQGITLRYWESVKLCYAGNFLNFVTALGTTGGDVFKMYYVSLHTRHKTEAVMTVLFDRIFGLVGLVLLVTTVSTVRWDDEKLTFLRGLSWLMFVGLIVAAVVARSSRMRRWSRIDSVIEKLPKADHLKRVLDGVQRLAGHKAAILGAAGSTAVLQILATLSFAFVGIAVGMRNDAAALWDYFAYIPSSMAIAAIPISFQGLGTQEAFYKHVFLDSHGDLSTILCMAMAIRIIGLMWSLPGVWVTLTGTYRPRSNEDVQLA